MSNKSWKFYRNPFTLHNVAKEYEPEKQNKNPASKGLNVTSPKSPKLFRVWCLTYPANFMKSLSSIFSNVANKHYATPSLGTVKQSSLA